MKAGVVDDSGHPLSNISMPTEAHKGQDFALDRMCETIRKAADKANVSMDDITAIGVATPGTMDIPKGIILDPPNLKPWRNVPVRDYVHNHFQLPTAFQNDANAAAYGEFWVGAGQQANSMVLYTLGTGVGGGIIIGDLVVQGEHSHGAELGHMKIEITKPRQCGCGRWGCLEAYSSATSVVKRAIEELSEPNANSSLSPFKDKADELTSEKIFIAAEEGDELANHIVDRTAFYLAVGATNLMHTIDPDMVVYAGGMTAAGEPFLQLIQKYVKELAFPVPAENTIIRYAQLGTDAGFIGAAACGRLLVKEN